VAAAALSFLAKTGHAVACPLALGGSSECLGSADSGFEAWLPSARLMVAAPARARPRGRRAQRRPVPLAAIRRRALPRAPFAATRRRQAGPQAPSLPRAARSGSDRSDW